MNRRLAPGCTRVISLIEFEFFLIFGAHSNKAAYFRDDDNIIMQDLPFTLPKYVDNLPPTTFESKSRTLKVNQIKDFENLVKESVFYV